jgi:alpha-amylase
MKVNLCFEVHHPLMFKQITNPDEVKFGKLKSTIFDHSENKKTFMELREKTYLPALTILRNSISSLKKKKKDFKFSINISGIFLDYAKKDKELIGVLKELAESGCVEFLGSTYYHSLAGLMDEKEFKNQARMHSKKIKKLFNQVPLTFVNPELIFNKEISAYVKDLGFESILTEGDQSLLGWRNPNFVYIDENGLKLFLRNKRLSNDITLRFSAKAWGEWPLTAEKYAYWISNAAGDCVNIYLNMRNFGHYHKEDSGIFWFLGALPLKINEQKKLRFSNFTRVVRDLHPVGEIKLPENEVLSWSGLSPVNDIQRKYLDELKNLGLIINETNNQSLAEAWRLLQVVESYKNEHGLHNLSNILHFMKIIANKYKKEPEAESETEPFVREDSLFSSDVFSDYFGGKLTDLESVSDSLRRRSFD